MFESSEISQIPSIGDIVHFHPDPRTRLAAIVVQTHPVQRDEATQEILRPSLDLQVCKLLSGKAKGDAPGPNLSFQMVPGVPAIDPDNIPDDLTGHWTFKNECNVQQPDDEDESSLLGTNSNFHVGNLTN